VRGALLLYFAAGATPLPVLGALARNDAFAAVFRAFHLKELGELFMQVVRLAGPPNGWITSVLGFR
jgi:hypothetical protein